MRPTSLTVAFIVLAAMPAPSPSSSAGEPSRGGASAPARDAMRARPEDVRSWQARRFGLFVHWGPCSIKGVEISHSRKAMGAAAYDNLYREFNPVKFDAKEWVAVAQAAGVKYLVFTAKHHDGFCEFDSRLTDYKITNSPFKRDVTAELATACREAGLGLGLYYSQPDWHHPDYFGPRHDRPKDFDPKNHERYVKYYQGQLRELCTNYGRVDVIWFDGLGGTAQLWDAENAFKLIRSLQPHALINDRCGLPGDFTTPEQWVGKFNADRPWESCITLCSQWSWRPNDAMKSLKECVDLLVTCAGGDGNLLLNVGPMPTGEIEPRQVERLKEIGAWLTKCGETIYGTRGGPVLPSQWLCSTRKDNAVYLHILSRCSRQFRLPPLPGKLVGSSVLTGGRVTVEQNAEGLLVSLPPESLQELDSIVKLEFDGPVADMTPVKARLLSLASGGKASASGVYRNQEKSHGAALAFDGDPDTRWATDDGTTQAWLGVDLPDAAAVGGVALSEYGDRVEAFELQYRQGDAWKPCARGGRIGAALELKFEPVTARNFRLLITKTKAAPSIYELLLLAPGAAVRAPDKKQP